MRKFLLGLIALFLLTIQIGLSEEMVEVPLSKLKELHAQIESDGELIDQLKDKIIDIDAERASAELEVLRLWAEIEALKSGFWIGTGIGYPLSWNVYGAYRFRRWGPYFTATVGNTNSISGGLMFKVGK